MSKNGRVSAKQNPLYHVLVGLQQLFFIWIHRRLGTAEAKAGGWAGPSFAGDA
jgi:hypothetical protein